MRKLDAKFKKESDVLNRMAVKIPINTSKVCTVIGNTLVAFWTNNRTVYANFYKANEDEVRYTFIKGHLTIKRAIEQRGIIVTLTDFDWPNLITLSLTFQEQKYFVKSEIYESIDDYISCI